MLKERECVGWGNAVSLSECAPSALPFCGSNCGTQSYLNISLHFVAFGFPSAVALGLAPFQEQRVLSPQMHLVAFLKLQQSFCDSAGWKKAALNVLDLFF